ncbi:unnamed protein product [Leptosia nina]|uniref:Uncharacterized protein n=1 Tax=Leptosia nina TaxID=320188 RepID=A0AAV1J9D8_9NEOP
MKYVRHSSHNMKAVAIILAFVTLKSCSSEPQVDAESYLSRFLADLWLEGADVVRIIWRDCSKQLISVKDEIDHKEYFPKFVRCMKRKTLKGLDRTLSLDLVPIVEGVNLVRFELVDRSGNFVTGNETSTWSDKDLENGDWRTLALQRIAKVLRTHVIKFEFGDRNVETVEQRGRRRHMLTMMMFGIVSMGMVLVPMGFQFLAVLGGKALLLAKMALILASIQGLKKIGTSPLSYGFYPTYPPYDHFERRSNDFPPSLKRSRHIAIKGDKIEEKPVTWKPVLNQFKDEAPRFLTHSQAPIVSTAIDAPTLDLTTNPGEVQADYTLELPYNGLNFQSSHPVVPS